MWLVWRMPPRCLQCVVTSYPPWNKKLVALLSGNAWLRPLIYFLYEKIILIWTSHWLVRLLTATGKRAFSIRLNVMSTVTFVLLWIQSGLWSQKLMSLLMTKLVFNRSTLQLESVSFLRNKFLIFLSFIFKNDTDGHFTDTGVQWKCCRRGYICVS